MTRRIGTLPRVLCPRCDRLVGTCVDEITPVAHARGDRLSGVRCRPWPGDRELDWRPRPGSEVAS